MRFTTKLTFLLTFIASLFSFLFSFASVTAPLTEIEDYQNRLIAFTNVNIVSQPGNIINEGTLLIENGKVIAAAKDAEVPEHARIVDLQGKWIYPSFIELNQQYGIDDIEPKDGNRPQYNPLRKGPYAWNDALRSDFLAHEQFSHDKDQAQELRKKGFGQVLTHRSDGIARGSGSLVTLDNGNEHESIIAAKAASHFSLSKGSSRQAYPNSLMGSIALLRQSFYDARWYEETGHKKETNLVLKKWNELSDLPAFFETDDINSALRAQKIGNEFDKNFIIMGNGDEYQYVNEITENIEGFVIPADFPEPYDVSDPYNAKNVTLRQLKHWEMAPLNPKILSQNNIPFAFSASQSDSYDEFIKNIRIAIAAGLEEEKALEALTIQPARFVNADDQTGSLEEGKLANFLITSGNIFEKNTVIYENWVRGKPEKLREKDMPTPEGTYQLTADKFEDLTMEIDGKSVKISSDGEEVSAEYRPERNYFRISFFHPVDDRLIRLSGRVYGEHQEILSGEGRIAEEGWFNWQAEKTASKDEAEREEEHFAYLDDTGTAIHPFRAYGNKTLPEQEDILIQNTTVWTNRDEGILENHDVLISNGVIAETGENLDAGDARVIDGSNRHLTPGILDEHSHIAISRGVNESSHPITSEVRIPDVIDPTDVNIYRQLSGGVTSAQLLHGSANPIGGQSALIKMRWGETAEGMLFEDAPPFIKFALGENVKQSHWGRNFNQRYPQTRMGVEQIIKEGFERAIEYQEEWDNYENLNTLQQRRTPAPRRNLQLEALSDILEEERFITCHSYVQTEINMLMKLADSLGFTVSTFTHAIEAYKVADKIKEHGAGVSAFTDWWNIKPELQDGIPHITSLLTWKGITTSIQSDNAELGRRLNHEAAKAVKYAGLDEEKALKLATLNPAKLLGVDDRVGSIAEGMDADIVLWNDHPLSVYAKADFTLVDGKIYFERDIHEEKMQEIEKERERLIEKMIRHAQNGSSTRPVEPEEDDEEKYNCLDHEH